LECEIRQAEENKGFEKYYYCLEKEEGSLAESLNREFGCFDSRFENLMCTGQAYF
jgi:hypothetical protein